MIRKIVMHCTGREVYASQTRAIEKYVFRFQSPGEIRFSNDSRRAIPVQGANRSAGFLDTIAVSVVSVRNPGGALNAVFGVVYILPRSGVIGEVSRSVVAKARCLIADVARMLEIPAMRLTAHGRD